MAARTRSNPLALAVLVALYERPMHPYDAAATLRRRGKHESVRLNYGSLYAIVDSLERRGLIAPQETERVGRLPERTIYAITDAGRRELHDWLTDLVSTPVKEYPAFEAALTFLPALAPEEASALLEERARRLEVELAEAAAAGRLAKEHGVPELFSIESEFRRALRAAELEYVRALLEAITSGSLEGLEWWHKVHETDGDPLAVPFSGPDKANEAEDDGGRA